MIPKVKNAMIFGGVALIFILIYVFFVRGNKNEDLLLSSADPTGTSAAATAITGDFLSLLLSVENLKLDDRIFSDTAFISLIDSSIVLVPDGNEGRVNPFAPIGVDAEPAPVNPPTSGPSTQSSPNSSIGNSSSGSTLGVQTNIDPI